MKRMLEEQIKNPKNGDWIKLVNEDKKDLEINETNEEIKEMSLNRYKALISKQTENAALKYLKSEIKSKGQEITYTELKIQDYLTSEYKEIKTKEKKEIFQMRSRMTKVKANMKRKQQNNKEDLKCDACKNENHEETQKHIYECEEIIKETNMKDTMRNKYEDIFTNNPVKMAKVSNIYFKHMKILEKLKN